MSIRHNPSIGGGEEIAIRELVQIIAETCEFKGNIIWDATKPDGQPRRAISITRANDLLDWWPQEEFKTGLLKTVRWYFEHSESLLPHDEQTSESDVKIAA